MHNFSHTYALSTDFILYIHLTENISLTILESEKIDVCYIHNVSPIKTPEQGGKQYFDCRIQTREKQVRGVCFDLSRHSDFAALDTSKSQVKLRRFHLSKNYESENIVMDDRTQLSNTECELNFKSVDTQSTIIPLSQISMIATEHGTLHFAIND